MKEIKHYSYNEYTSLDDLRSKTFKENIKHFKSDRDYSLVDINKYKVKGSDQTITLGIMIRNGL